MPGWEVAAGAMTAIGPSGKYLAYRQNMKNVNEQKHQNALDRQFQTDMYATQRRDALSDRDYTNQYNDP